MKKLMLLCVAMVCCMCSFAQAWDNSKPDRRVTFGVKAGLNMHKLKGDHGYSDGLNSFHAGVNLDYNISKSFALETGVFLTDKGYRFDKLTDKGDRIGSDDSHHRVFVQIPILARFKFYVNEDFNIQLRAGGFGAPRIGGNGKDSWGDDFAYKDIDAGLIGGLGISYKNFYLGAQFEYGLMEILKGMGAHTSNIAISLGYDF